MSGSRKTLTTAGQGATVLAFLNTNKENRSASGRRTWQQLAVPSHSRPTHTRGNHRQRGWSTPGHRTSDHVWNTSDDGWRGSENRSGGILMTQGAGAWHPHGKEKSHQ